MSCVAAPTSFAQVAKDAINAIPAGTISERNAADLIVAVLDAAGVVGPEQRDRVLHMAAREFAAGDQVPGGGY